MAETDAKKAIEILAPRRKPDRAEQAALDCVETQRWVLWHADDYAAAVVRLLSRAGLLRDQAREAELAEADLVMRRLEDEDKAKLRREHSAALAELALHVDCRTDISIGDALRHIRSEESNAPARTPVSAATEAHGQAGEAQEGRE